MPMYEYKCKLCGLISTTTSRDDPVCAHCQHTDVRRIFSFNPLKSFQPHYNVALGRWVNSRSDFKDGLKIASEESSIRTGIDTNYVPVDWQDQAAFKPTDDGMDEYNRVHQSQPVMPEDVPYIS